MPALLSRGTQRVPPEPTPYEDMELGDNIYERVGMSLYNAIRLDPEASIRALVAPDTLPPTKRRKVSSDFLEGRTGLERFVLSEITNPLVLAGAAMSFRWPILDPTKYRGALKTLQQYERWIPSPLRKLLGLNELFAGTPIPDLASRIPVEADNFSHKYLDVVGDGILLWRKAMGRKEAIVDELRWGIMADKTFSPRGIKAINRVIKSYNAKGGHARIPLLKESDIRLEGVEADRLVVDPWVASAKRIPVDLADKERLAHMAAMSSRLHGATVNVNWIEGGYFPRQAMRNYRQVAEIRQRLIDSLIRGIDETGMTDLRRIQQWGQATGRAGTTRLLRRRERLIPDVTELSRLPAGSISDKALYALSEVRERAMLSGKPSTYSLRFSPTVMSYGFSMGRSYAWHYLGLGDELIKEAKTVYSTERKLGLGVGKSELLRNVYIPALLGTTSFETTMKATEWSGIRQAMWATLSNPKAMQGVPGYAKEAVRRIMEEDSLWHPETAGSRISNYFYASTLGLNLGSATQNLLQPILTTAPFIGFGNTVRGMTKVIGKIPEYLRLRSNGLNEVDALKKLFPNFVESGGELGALSTELALRESADIAKGGLFGIRSTSGKLRDVLLAPFRNAELFNRLSTFEGAMEQGLANGMAHKDALLNATQAVNLTQLWAGGASSPSFMAKWWGPFRQFLTFPGKMAGFALGSVVPTYSSGGWQLGIGGGFDPGVLGRAMLYSATAYEVAKEFSDADLSRSLLFGGLPLPQEQSVLSPLPVLPPIVSLGAGAVQDLVTGDPKNVKRGLALLVPGGMQMAKLSQSYAPMMARLLGRGYADTEKTLPDGRVPMYDSKGNLVGYKTSFDLFLSNIGIPGKLLGPDGSAKVQEIEKYFLNHRETMREMRRGYIDAVTEGDHVAAEKLQTQHLADYGSEIEIRPQDWEAAQYNQYIPRLERIVKTLPVGVRDRFLRVAQTALSGRGERFLGIDPMLFGAPRREIASLLRSRNLMQTEGVFP